MKSCAIGLGLVVLVHCTPAQQQQGAAVAKEACQMITAFGGTEQEQSLCADAADVIAIEANIRASRADSGPVHGLLRCKIVGTICATDTEIAHAIVARKLVLQ